MAAEKAPVFPNNRTLLKLFLAGVAAWPISGIAFFVWENFVEHNGYGASIGLFYPHSGGFLPSGLFLIAYGIFQRLKSHVDFKTVFLAAFIYFLPTVLILSVWFVFSAVVLPPTVSIEPWVGSVVFPGFILFGFPGFLFYLAALGIAWKRSRREPKRATLGLVIPLTFLAALYCAALLAAAFSSPAWTLRNEVSFSKQQVTTSNGRFIVEGAVHIEHDSPYVFQALFERSWSPKRRLGGNRGVAQIGSSVPLVWLDGDHQAPRRMGTYPFRIAFDKAFLGDDGLPPNLLPAYQPESQFVLLEVLYETSKNRSVLVKEFRIPLER